MTEDFTTADAVLTLVAENDGRFGWYAIEHRIHTYDVPSPFLKPTFGELVAAGLLIARADEQSGQDRFWITRSGQDRYDDLQRRGGVPRR